MVGPRTRWPARVDRHHHRPVPERQDQGCCGACPVAQLPRAGTDKKYVRVTDKQRDVVVEELSKQFAAGTLDQATFDARMSAATSAVHQDDLDMLTLDLPVLP